MHGHHYTGNHRCDLGKPCDKCNYHVADETTHICLTDSMGCSSLRGVTRIGQQTPLPRRRGQSHRTDIKLTELIELLCPAPEVPPVIEIVLPRAWGDDVAPQRPQNAEPKKNRGGVVQPLRRSKRQRGALAKFTMIADKCFSNIDPTNVEAIRTLCRQKFDCFKSSLTDKVEMERLENAWARIWRGTPQAEYSFYCLHRQVPEHDDLLAFG